MYIEKNCNFRTILFPYKRKVATLPNPFNKLPWIGGYAVAAEAGVINDVGRVAGEAGGGWVAEAEGGIDGGDLIGYRNCTKFLGHSHRHLRIFAGMNGRNIGLFSLSTSRCCPEI